MSFRDKVVIVTGATSGIGRATAEAFGREGARSVLVGRNDAALTESWTPSRRWPRPVVCRMGATPRRAAVIVVERWRHWRTRRPGQRRHHRDRGLEATTDGVDSMMAINLRAVFMMWPPRRICGAEGAIVNVSSVNGLRSFAVCSHTTSARPGWIADAMRAIGWRRLGRSTQSIRRHHHQPAPASDGGDVPGSSSAENDASDRPAGQPEEIVR
jgi:NAD(P)-dependent dehydrogenase (short-subunit alcohol dehydrogenase family)